jgi:hypothetical protein
LATSKPDFSAKFVLASIIAELFLSTASKGLSSKIISVPGGISIF